ncbi:MAG: hypothetical protein IT324_22950 [Anaerolineae bacterium]|nr:hypothetical protein [Anaerolineae bacterium]
MSTRTISIPVSDELAMRDEYATDEQRRSIQAALEVLIRALTWDNARSLGTVMDDVSDKAEARGLTPEHLSELLKAS